MAATLGNLLELYDFSTRSFLPIPTGLAATAAKARRLVICVSPATIGECLA
jgi:hypothetical protein